MLVRRVSDDGRNGRNRCGRWVAAAGRFEIADAFQLFYAYDTVNTGLWNGPPVDEQSRDRTVAEVRRRSAKMVFPPPQDYWRPP